jgi:pimeloyl-ACP methyl ester carboxylesterase
MATFVIIHGAWTGGWSWVRVLDRLHAKGHHAYVPTLTGNAERSHLARRSVNLKTHIKDIVNEIMWKDLQDIVLVAHSYGGIVAGGVCEEVGERITSLVFLEAFVPKNGRSFADDMAGYELKGPMVPPPPSSPGDYLREEDRKWVDEKATAQCIGTMTQKLKISGAFQRVGKKTYIVAPKSFGEAPKQLRDDPSWTIREIAGGHDAPIDAPDELTELLEAAIPRQ